MSESLGTATAGERPRRRWLRRLQIVAVSSSAGALLCGGAVAGWWGRDRFGSHPAPVVTVTRPVTVSSATTPAADSMPNVLGLDGDSARQALADAGIDLAKVTVKNQPYAGAPGVVIGQSPSAATTPLPSRMTLTLSAQGTMPDLTGMTLDAARTELSTMGATVTVRTRYEAGAAEGTILQTQPAAGDTLSEQVALVIAEPPSSVFLDQLRAINSSCGTDTVYVAGIERQNALVCQPSEGSPSVMEYVLNRRVSAFQAVIGVSDTGATDTPVMFRVVVDGKARFSVSMPFGKARRISVPVVGALRIRLEAVVPKEGPSGEQVDAVFGIARFVGGRSAINQLSAEAHP